MKMWAGRFSKEVDDRVNDFNSSIRFDCRMYEQDIKGSLAHAAMLAAQGIIPQEDADAIAAGLEGVLADLKSGALVFDPGAEDIHMFVEAELTKRIGGAGKRLHTARSRNDQVALDLRLTLREEAKEIKALLLALISELRDRAAEHLDTVMPGYTHLQRAQPVTFAHHLAAYANMFLRDVGRVSDAAGRMEFCPLGSGALAGTTYPIDRQRTAAALGFTAPTANSLDGVSDLHGGKLLLEGEKDVLTDSHRIVKGRRELLTGEVERLLCGVEATEFGFRGLAGDPGAVHALLGDEALYEKPTVEDLFLGYTRRERGEAR